MMLVEALRLRRWMTWWAAAMFVIAAGLGIAVQQTGLIVNGARLNHIAAPLDALGPIAMFLAMIFATSAGLSLNKEAESLALSWTKPLSRRQIALHIMAVDVAAVVAGYVFAWILILAVVAMAGGVPVVSPDAPLMIALTLGVAVMWYALVEAVTAALPTTSRGVVGFLWPGALLLSAIHATGIFGAVVTVINTINPLAYLNHVGGANGDGPDLSGFWAASPDVRALLAWMLSAVLAAVAIGLWTRREA